MDAAVYAVSCRAVAVCCWGEEAPWNVACHGAVSNVFRRPVTVSLFSFRSVVSPVQPLCLFLTSLSLSPLKRNHETGQLPSLPLPPGSVDCSAHLHLPLSLQIKMEDALSPLKVKPKHHDCPPVAACREDHSSFFFSKFQHNWVMLHIVHLQF